MTDKNKDARYGTRVLQAKPFENDPELKRICNRLGGYGSQLAGWINSKEPVRMTRFERLMVAVHKGS
jgi:hypothetical protein